MADTTYASLQKLNAVFSWYTPDEDNSITSLTTDALEEKLLECFEGFSVTENNPDSP